MYTHHRIVAAVLAATSIALTFSAAIPFAAAATYSLGDLVKLADDGNFDTTADSAVYYVGEGNKRYAFPNSQAYFTWYADFDGVKIVSAADLAAMPLAGNITYRAGTRLVKITSDPNVYAVEPGGSLRWVQTEGIAKTLFGDDWSKRVDDIPDAFFFNYKVGAPLAAASFPSGSVVKRADGQLYHIVDGIKRHVTSDDVRKALRVQDRFILATTESLDTYPDGAEISAVETSLTDTSQKATVASAATVPTFVNKPSGTTFFGISGDVAFLELHLSSKEAVTVRKLTVKLETTTDKAGGTDTDDDVGGLVYGNNARPNFTNLRFRDDTGTEPFGRREVAVDIFRDNAQTFVFEGAYVVPAGTERVLTFFGHTNSLLPNGEGYKATLVRIGTSLSDIAGGAAAFLPETDIVGPTMSSLALSVELKDSDKPGNNTYVRGALNAAISGVTFKATTVAPNVIDAVTFQGYIDEEGNGSFLAGSDTDNGSPTTVRDMLPKVSLYDANDVKVGGPVDVTADGRAAFTGLHYKIAAGASAPLIVKGDIPKTLDVEEQPNRVVFDVKDPGGDVKATDDKGNPVGVVNALPNNGPKATHYATVKKSGTVGFTWTPAKSVTIAGRETSLGTLAVATKDDAYLLKTFSFKKSGDAKSLGNVRLAYTDATGTEKSVTRAFLGTTLTFSGQSIALPANATTTLKLFGQIAGMENGAVYGEKIAVTVDQDGLLQFVSTSTDQTYDATARTDGSGVLSIGESLSDITVRFSGLTFFNADGAPKGDIYRDAPLEILRFSARAESEGAVKIRKFAFNLSPSFVKVHADDPLSKSSGALERWAKLNGDFAEDDSIATLYVVYPGGTRQPIGQGSSGHVTYAVRHGSALITAPSTLAISEGDTGVLTVDLGQSYELTINPTQQLTFSLMADMTVFDGDASYPFGVTLPGDGISWTDNVKSDVMLGGSDATGLPQATTFTVQK